MFCPECGTELPDHAKFCTRCRYDFTRIKTPPPKKAFDPFLNISPTIRSDDPSDLVDILETGSKVDNDLESLEVGSLFANRYEILSEGMKGGMGVVYKCRDRKLNRIIALKVIHPRLLGSDEAVQRFRQEVSISLDLLDKNIVRVHNLDEFDGIEFFTMEWVEGKSLREMLSEKKKANQPFTLEEAYAIISQLCSALGHAHQSTVHRDIKPENILVIEKGGEIQIKLTDFGIAKILTQSQLALSGAKGTPYYMAPEQKEEGGIVDKRADIYSVGVVLFELLTLRNTIGPYGPSKLNKQIPKEVDEIFERAVELEPESRYQSIQEFADALREVIEGKTKRIEEERKKREELSKTEAERLQQEAEEAEGIRREKEREKREDEDRRGKIRSLLGEGKDHFNYTRFDRAIEAFEKVIQMDNANNEARELLERAKSYKKKVEEERIKEEEERKRRAAGPRPGEIFQDDFTGMEFVWVLGGKFDMGDTFGDGESDEKPVHEVYVDGFWIGKYEVTQGQWEKVMGNNPSYFKKSDNYPVEFVTWNDVQEFIQRLNQRTRKKYRLPTEAEWEYAARSGGKQEKYAGTSSESELGGYAWYSDNSGGGTRRVGQKKPNGLGLYDMSGNVWEWCEDWYGENYYKNSPKDNPKGPSEGKYKVLRGGSWNCNPRNIRASFRFRFEPTYRKYYYGFRLVLPSQ